MNEVRPYESPLEELRDLLELVHVRLLHRDAVLGHAAATAGLGPSEALPVVFLHDNVEPHRVPLTPALGAAMAAGLEHVRARAALTAREHLGFATLAAELGLTRIEQLLLLTAIAPQFSTGFLQAFDRLVPGHDAGRLPLGAMADLVSSSDEERWQALAALRPDAPLIATGLLVTDAPMSGLARGDAQTSVSASPVVLDYFFAADLAPRRPTALGGLARRVPSRRTLDALPLSAADRAALLALAGVEGRTDDGLPHVGVLVTGDLAGADVAEAVAAAAGRDLLFLTAIAEGASPTALVSYRQVALYTRLHDLLLVVELRAPEAIGVGSLSYLVEAIAEAPQILFVSQAPVPALTGVEEARLHPVSLAPMGARAREWIWRDALSERVVEGAEIARLAARFPLDDREIRAIAREAGPSATFTGLAQAARARLRHGDEGLAERVEIRAGLDELIVGAECRARLDELCLHLEHAERVERRLDLPAARGKRMSALFYGPAGTGKTFAAAAVAHASGRGLFRIELTQIVDRYVADIERKLDRTFRWIESQDGILLFDELETLFTRRPDGAQERFANVQLNLLLQRMEAYPGLSILTANPLEAIDPAFRRRIQFQIPFTKPTAELRQRLWRQALAELGGAHIDERTVNELADSLDLSGGFIRNAIIKAAVLASSRGLETFDAATLADSANRELRALGSGVPAARPLGTGTMAM